MVSYCGQSMSIMRRGASTIALKAYSSYSGLIDLILIFRFFSWTEGPTDLKLGGKCQGDL